MKTNCKHSHTLEHNPSRQRDFSDPLLLDEATLWGKHKDIANEIPHPSSIHHIWTSCSSWSLEHSLGNHLKIVPPIALLHQNIGQTSNYRKICDDAFFFSSRIVPCSIHPYGTLSLLSQVKLHVAAAAAGTRQEEAWSIEKSKQQRKTTTKGVQY